MRLLYQSPLQGNLKEGAYSWVEAAGPGCSYSRNSTPASFWEELLPIYVTPKCFCTWVEILLTRLFSPEAYDIDFSEFKERIVSQNLSA